MRAGPGVMKEMIHEVGLIEMLKREIAVHLCAAGVEEMK
jgi:hypothetical protein